MRNTPYALLAAAVIAGGGPVFGLEVRGGDDARWVSGGIGDEERAEMLYLLPDYNLRVLTAAEKSGAYLAGTEVVVRDAAGRVLFETRLDGPLLFVRLPPGKYELQATYAGKAQTRTLTIPAAGRRELHLYWSLPGVETLPKGETQ